jgi:allophanate hydrolase subunit 1
VAVAGEFTSVYPTASPGGWQLIGRTDVPVWRPEASRPALLEPGTRVRFVDA